MKKQYAIYLLLILTACGGGGNSGGATTDTSADIEPQAVLTSNSSTAASIETAEVQSEAIVADEQFDFRIDSEINLSINAPKGEQGVAHIYGASDPNVPAGFAFPDFTSRITSINPALNPKALFSYSGADNTLWVQWVPTSSKSNEQLIQIALVQGQLSYSVDVN